MGYHIIEAVTGIVGVIAFNNHIFPCLVYGVDIGFVVKGILQGQNALISRYVRKSDEKPGNKQGFMGNELVGCGRDIMYFIPPATAGDPGGEAEQDASQE